MRYVREIDGLRAVSVLVVLFYHAKFLPFAGGFVGVDVFFVISGYLITMGISESIRKDTFSLSGFYLRRARRLAPALLPVLLFCLVCSWFILMPNALRDLSQSLAAVAVFSSNFLFWIETGYFAPEPAVKVLIHTWSLAVEEQFYLLFPFCLLALRGRSRRTAFLAFAAAAVVSLAWAQWGSTHHASANFYLLPSRCWELLAGACLALLPVRRKRLSVLWAEGASLLGAGLLAYAVFFFNPATPYPSLYTVIPVVGAMLLIAFAPDSVSVRWVLSSRAMVGLGLVSYSTYLWHQPLFVFSRLSNAGEVSLGAYLILIVASIVVGALSWKYVEQPVRHGGISNQRFVQLATGLSVVLFCLGMIGHHFRGFPERLTADQRAIMEYENFDIDKAYGDGRCFLNGANQYPHFSPECLGDSQDKTRWRVLVWGDSFSAHLREGLDKLHPQLNLAQFSTVCPPIFGVESYRETACREFDTFVLDQVTRFAPNQIVLAANWVAHPDQRERLESTLARIRLVAPGAQVLLVGNLPRYYPSLPSQIVEAGQGPHAASTVHAHLDSVRSEDGILRTIAERAGVVFVDVINAICRENQCPGMVRWQEGFQPYSWDFGHLTAAGSVTVVEQLPLGPTRRALTTLPPPR